MSRTETLWLVVKYRQEKPVQTGKTSRSYPEEQIETDKNEITRNLQAMRTGYQAVAGFATELQ
jgi:hypothetical protein